MKVRDYCMDCLKNLARQAVALSQGDASLVASCCRLVEALFEEEGGDAD